MENLETLEAAAAELVRKISGIKEMKQSPIVLIDGRAGSGKSTLANTLKDLIFKEFDQAPYLIHMDDLYPGWEGLSAGSQYLFHKILQPLKSRGTAEWQVWNWAKGIRGADDPGNGWRNFDGDNLLIVEGCGAVSRNSADLADLCIWVESDEGTRKRRFMDRDGGRDKDYWGMWSALEDEFYESEKSKSWCEVTIEN